MSLKESLLEILDCCLNHEERVSDVERRCEENYQHIRSLLYNGWRRCTYFIVIFRHLMETAEKKGEEESKAPKEEKASAGEESSQGTGDDERSCQAEVEKLDQNCNASQPGPTQEGDGCLSTAVALLAGAGPRDRLNNQLVLTLSSTGKTVSWEGSSSCLGQFLYYGDHNQAPAYHQRHTVKGTKSRFLFKSPDGSWCISSELGSRRGQMRSNSRTASVPTSDWFGFSEGNWVQDPGVTVTPGIIPPCKSIIIMFRGEINANVGVYNNCVGLYVLTSQWSRGCPVYKHSHRPLYLSKFSGWTISSTPGTGAGYLENRAGALCPADQRGSWMDPVMLRGVRREGDFIVQCDVHVAQ